MAPPRRADDAPDAAPPEGGPASGWLGGVQTLVLSVVSLVGDGLELLSLELQRGLHLLERLLWLLLVAGAALMGAWLFFWAGLALMLVDAGMTWPLACAAVVLANAAVLALCLSQARLLRSLFTLDALRRPLAPFGRPEGDPPGGSSPPDGLPRRPPPTPPPAPPSAAGQDAGRETGP